MSGESSLDGQRLRRVRRRRNLKTKKISKFDVQSEGSERNPRRQAKDTATLMRDVVDELQSVRNELSLLRRATRCTTQSSESDSAQRGLERARSPPAGLRGLLRRVVSPRRASVDVAPLRRSPLYHSALHYSPERSTLFDERTEPRNATPLRSPRFSGGTAASDLESDTSDSALARSPCFCVERSATNSCSRDERLPVVTAEDVQIGALIGNGAVARVYSANTLGFGVAVKVYCQSFGPGSEAICSELWRKLEAIRSLDAHPHVLRVFGNRLEGEHLVSTMERMDCTLQQLIDQRRAQHMRRFSVCAGHKECQTRQLCDLCLCSAPFAPLEVLGITRQCASALAYLHSLPQPVQVRGSGARVLAVWHRDLKSENICARRTSGTLQCLLREMGSDSSAAQQLADETRLDQCYTFALADWDEARIVYDEDGASDNSTKWEDPSSLPRAASSARRVAYSTRRLTRSPRLRERLSLDVGTAQFMAPEMMDHSTDTYNESVDIWSLGMVLYQLLTLSMPYALDVDVDNFSLSTRVESGVRPTLPRHCYLRDLDSRDDEDDETDDICRSKKVWHAIVHLYENCSSLNPEVRPSAEMILQRIETVMSAL